MTRKHRQDAWRFGNRLQISLACFGVIERKEFWNNENPVGHAVV